MVFSHILRLAALAERLFCHHLRITALLGVALCGIMQACAPAKLSNVLIGDRTAGPGEYHRVQVFQKEMPVQTQQGMDLTPDSVIETDDQSWAVINFTSGPRVIMKPGTRGRISSFDIEFGEIVVIIEKRLSGLFKVKTEDVIAGPESTIFSVSKALNGPSTVSVIRGAVRLTAPTQAWACVTIRQNQRASTASGKPPKSERLPKEDFNEIVSWANRVELAISPAQANVIVPNLDSLPQEAARRLIQAAGLSIGQILPKVTATRPPLGTVVEQQPAAGTSVAKGTAVTIGVEVEPVRLPQLIHQSLPNAQALLIQNGLKLGRVDCRITGSAPPETVIAQQPASGVDVPSGSTVDLVVEEASVRVPHLIGMHRNNIGMTLNQQRLIQGTLVEQITGRYPVGTVIQQDPPPGQRVRLETPIHLTVEAVSFAVPNITGMMIDVANQTLRNTQLRFGQIREALQDNANDGVVLHQSPPPGQRVASGTPIDIVKAIRGIHVPNLVGQNQEGAQAILRQQRLGWGGVSTRPSDARASWNRVVDQSPRSGTLARSGTPVAIVIGTMPPCQVPNVVGMTAANADNAIRAARLVPYNQNNAPGNAVVRSQSPTAGASLNCGATVSYVAILIVKPIPTPILRPQLPPGTIYNQQPKIE